MAHYDEATHKFIDDVSGQKRPVSEQLARQGVSLVRGIAHGGMKELPKQVVKRAVGVATILADMEKESSIPILKIIESLNDKYDWYDWEPETLWQTIEGDFSSHPSTEVKNILQAFQVAARTNYPFEDWHIFENVGQAFNENSVNFGQVQPLEMDEAAYTIKILTMLRPKQEFTDDIKAYIASCAKEAGMVYLPEDLYPAGCQKFLDTMGNDVGLRDRVASLYPKILKMDLDTAIGIQLARLSEVIDYVKERS